jgi:hypothetical protein
MQRIIFRPAAMQRYVQGSCAQERKRAVIQPSLAGWYVLIAASVVLALAALFIPLEGRSPADGMFSDQAKPKASASAGDLRE